MSASLVITYMEHVTINGTYHRTN